MSLPPGFLDELRTRVSLTQVVGRKVMWDQRKSNQGKGDMWSPCPFHHEKTASFHVDDRKGFYYCFGCHAKGDALKFIQETENVGFMEAVEILAQEAGMEMPARDPRAQQKQDHRSQLAEVMEQAVRFFRMQLKTRPAEEARSYLARRGLSPEAQDRWEIGFAPDGWQNLWDALRGKGVPEELILGAGLAKPSNKGGKPYDTFRNRIMFPIRDARGRAIAFGGRAMDPNDNAKYLNSPETDIFHKGVELYGLYEARQANRQLERIVVVEGYMDVIALAQHGISYATATLGTATSETHIKRIYRMCPQVVFCFDGDEAGRKAAFRAMESTLPAMEDGKQAKFLFLPEGMDPDDAVRGKGRDYFEALMAQAVPLEEFLFDAVSDGLDTSSLDGRARMSKAALPYIRLLPEGIFRQLMYQALAERTGLELHSLMQLEVPAPPPMQEAPEHPDYPMDAMPPPATEADWAPPADDPGPVPDGDMPAGDDYPTVPPARLQREAANLAQRAIALILHQPDVALSAKPQQLEGLEGPDVQLLRELVDLLHRSPGSNPAMLLGHWYGTSEGELLGRLADVERVVPAEGIEQEFIDILAKLAEELPHHSKLRSQVDKLKLTNYADMSESDKQGLRELLQEKQRRDARRNRSGQ